MLFCLYVSAPVFYTENHGTKYRLTRAIVLDHTLNIDKYYTSQLSDWSRYGGHFYTNKAPGPSLLAVFPYWIVATWQRWRGENPAEKNFQNLLVIDAFVTKLPSVLLALLFLSYLGARGVHSHWQWALTLGYAIGTIAYPFSTMMWGHQTAAFFVFLSFYSIFVNWNPTLAGAALGMGVLSDYAALVMIPACGVALLLEARRRKDFLKFLLGTLPPFVVYAWYHKTCFNMIFGTAVAYSNPVFGGNQDSVWAVLSIPPLTVFWDLLFGSQRGLFFISPALFLAAWGLGRGWKSPYKREVVFAAWCCLVTLCLNAGFHGWHGGWSSGPRYLVPVLPLLAIGWVHIPWKKTLGWLLVLSVLTAWLIASVNPVALPDHNLFLEEIFPKMGSARALNALGTQGLQILLLGALAFNFLIKPVRKPSKKPA